MHADTTGVRIQAQGIHPLATLNTLDKVTEFARLIETRCVLAKTGCASS